MTYEQVTEWLFSQLPVFQTQGKTAFNNKLENVIALDNYLDNPSKKFKSIHIAGTNGKGSTSSMLASVLQEAGYKVGLYTSPHLKDFRERIKINGILVSEQYVDDFVTQHKAAFKQYQLSFFEMTVGMAFDYFSTQKVDVAIIEVGMGGRLDATNIISPLVSVITNIGLDHTQYLGTTLPLIAAEKGGIIKENTPVIIGEYHPETFPIFEKLATSKKADLYKAFNMEVELPPIGLLGNYQIKNAKTVLKTVELLQSQFIISTQNIKNGLLNVVTNTGLQGRWQIIQNQPLAICDTAHNTHGLIEVVLQLEKINKGQLHFVIGMVKEKDISAVIAILPKNAIYYFCAPKNNRACSAEELQKLFHKKERFGAVFNSVSEAYKNALTAANTNDTVFVGGSNFVVAEIV